MQQGFRKLVLLVGAASLAGGGVIVAACGTDNGSTVDTPQVEAGKDVVTADTFVPTDGGTTDSGEGGVDCSKNPKLRDNTAGFRCAFLAASSGDGGASTCTPTETCCNPNDKDGGAFEPAFCATGKVDDTGCGTQAAGKGSVYTSGAAWECADNAGCTGGQVCCMIQDPARLALDPVNNKLKLVVNSKDSVHPVACGALDALNAGGSRCKASCDTAANDVRLCSMTDNGCGAGTTCTPFYDYTHFVDRGFCK